MGDEEGVGVGEEEGDPLGSEVGAGLFVTIGGEVAFVHATVHSHVQLA